jgi:hypothetical protein
MKRSSLILPLFIACAAATSQAQNQNSPREPLTRPRTISSLPKPTQESSPEPVGKQASETFEKPAPQSKTIESPGAAPTQVSAAPVAPTDQSATTLRWLTPSMTRTRIAEAERLLKSHPLQTAMTSPSIEFVTLAALDRGTSRIHLLTLSKETFLTRGADVTQTSSLGTPLSIRVLRANGVNTAVTIFDDAGRYLVPLVVEFPIEKRGIFREMAYYTSAHPALLSRDLVRSGQSYVGTMLDLAATRLGEKGAFISPRIVDLAERLCLVEHVDHERFRLETPGSLFDEIYSLYALNQLDTYRYSVSSAGAGGMVQMIPCAYNLELQRHPAVGLIPDFVVGMRNHANALQAMLLYMQDTWTDLAASEDVQNALSSGIATQSELLAAGYNSNAAHLPLYLRRAGQAWRTLIPRETKTYLQIYKTVDGLLPMKPRSGVVSQAID